MKTVTFDEKEWKLMPRQCTDEMMKAFDSACYYGTRDYSISNYYSFKYGNMMEHAPVPPEIEHTPSRFRVVETIEFNTGDEKLDYLLSNTYHLLKEGGQENAVLWNDSLDAYLKSLGEKKYTEMEVLEARADGYEHGYNQKVCTSKTKDL